MSVPKGDASQRTVDHEADANDIEASARVTIQCQWMMPPCKAQADVLHQMRRWGLKVWLCHEHAEAQRMVEA